MTQLRVRVLIWWEFCGEQRVWYSRSRTRYVPLVRTGMELDVLDANAMLAGTVQLSLPDRAPAKSWG